MKKFLNIKIRFDENMTPQEKFTAVNTVTAQLHPQFLILYSVLLLYNITVDYWFIVLRV